MTRTRRIGEKKVVGCRVRRKQRLKMVYEGRKRQLEAARQTGDSYGYCVTRYDRARRAWRAFRGWI